MQGDNNYVHNAYKEFHAADTFKYKDKVAILSCWITGMPNDKVSENEIRVGSWMCRSTEQLSIKKMDKPS